MEQAIIESQPQQPTVSNDYDIDAFIAKRKEFIEKVNAIMVEKKDYHVIQGRKSMAKGGAEKIANIFGYTATFEKDQDAMEAFSSLKEAGIICFICNLTKNGQLVGQGRGAAALAKNDGDPNKTLKMAEKSAFIDAVIRASGLSDFYTQDLENMNPAEVLDVQPKKSSYGGTGSATRPMGKASPAQITTIIKIMDQKGYTVDDIINQGFSPFEQLTGGREGTASELIDWLIKAGSKEQASQHKITDEEAAMYM